MFRKFNGEGLPLSTHAITVGRHHAWLLDDRIIYLRLGSADPHFDGRITQRDAIDASTMGKHLLPDGPFYSIVDMRSVIYSDAQSRRVLPPLEQKAVGLLIANPLGRMLARAYLGVSTPPIPMRIFRAEADALTWLKALGG